MAAEKIKKELRCYLTEAETVTYAKQAAVLVERIEDQENEKKMTAKQYAAEISALQDELFGLSRKVRNGFEVRPVECEEIMDFEKKEVLIVRLDTFEPIESRKMTSKELQKPLFVDAVQKEAEDLRKCGLNVPDPIEYEIGPGEDIQESEETDIWTGPGKVVEQFPDKEELPGGSGFIVRPKEGGVDEN